MYGQNQSGKLERKCENQLSPPPPSVPLISPVFDMSGVTISLIFLFWRLVNNVQTKGRIEGIEADVGSIIFNEWKAVILKGSFILVIPMTGKVEQISNLHNINPKSTTSTQKSMIVNYQNSSKDLKKNQSISEENTRT